MAVESVSDELCNVNVKSASSSRSLRTVSERMDEHSVLMSLLLTHPIMLTYLECALSSASIPSVSAPAEAASSSSSTPLSVLRRQQLLSGCRHLVRMIQDCAQRRPMMTSDSDASSASASSLSSSSFVTTQCTEIAEFLRHCVDRLLLSCSPSSSSSLSRRCSDLSTVFSQV